MVPTFGAEPVMGTNPLAFAAPARRNPPFELDMATTTVAAGKVKVYKLQPQAAARGLGGGRRRPAGDGRRRGVGLRLRAARRAASRPLGGDRELGGHKGYGLAVMVHILGGVLGGRLVLAACATAPRSRSDPHNIGHFFLAIDPARLPRRRASSRRISTRSSTCSTAPSARTRTSRCSWPAIRRWRTRAERLEHGVPVPDDLMTQLRAVAESAGVPFVLACNRSSPCPLPNGEG